MENLDNLNSREEVQNAYTRATRNMTPDAVMDLEASPGGSSADSPLVAHAKACYRKLQTFSSAGSGASDATPFILHVNLGPT